MKQTIFTGFAPNLQSQDVRLAVRFLLQPWRWQRGEWGTKAKNAIGDFFERPAYLCDSGRSALFLALQALGIDQGDEVLVQAFTCLAVANAIRATGATPVYIDVDRSYNMDPADAIQKISTRTKVIILQHTFGIPAQIDPLMHIAKTRKLLVIEDCAHALGGAWQNKKMGTLGDAAILSFGADKVISCARGGAIIATNPAYDQKIQQAIQGLRQSSYRCVLQHLLYFIFFFFGKPLYSIGLGKILLWLGHHLHLISRTVYPAEKRGERMPHFPAQLPNALAAILFTQWQTLAQSTNHRRIVAKRYEETISNPHVVLPLRDIPIDQGSVYLRYPILVEKPYELYLHAKNQGIILGNWFDAVVSPKPSPGVDFGYNWGSCKRAERISRQSVNLPTDLAINEAEIKRIIVCLNSYKPTV